MDLGAFGIELQHAAEIADLDIDHLVTFGHRKHIGWLHVTVNQALAVDIAQRHGALEADFDDLFEREQGVGPTKTSQRGARHVFHHQVRLQRVGHRVIDLHDVRVRQAAHERCLGREEPFVEVRADAATGRIGQRRAHTFDSHFAAAEVIAGMEDFAGCAFAKAAQDAVASDVAGQPVRPLGNGLHGVADGQADDSGHC